jgi:NAD(P)-dependent dehydrogenase (short-subunit alcohol dehydrogenase family)
MGERKPVVVVTGAGQGIGRGIALDLLGRGYQVAALELDAEALAELLASQAGSPDLLGHVLDITDEAAVKRCIDATTVHFGALDGLVNNAGISEPHDAPLEAMALSDFERVLRVNLTGAFICAKHAASQLRRSKRGAIVNIASTRALQSEPRSEAYAAAKGGLVALTHALALSLGKDVRVNAVSPGFIDVSALKKESARRADSLREVDHTQHPVGRVGTAADVASLVAYLLSPESGFMTGQNLVLDGGMTRKMIYAE